MTMTRRTAGAAARLASLACLALASAAHAEMTVNQGGVKLVPPPANTGAVVPAEQASTLRDPRKPAGQTLRCWQAGRLLFESQGFRAQAERQPNAVVVPRLDGEAVVVFDQRDSVCILSRK